MILRKLYNFISSNVLFSFNKRLSLSLSLDSWNHTELESLCAMLHKVKLKKTNYNSFWHTDAFCLNMSLDFCENDNSLASKLLQNYPPLPPKNMVLHGTTCYYMLHGTTCYMVLHVTWYYMLNGTTCYIVLHVTRYYF